MTKELRLKEENDPLQADTSLTYWLANPYIKAATADNTRLAYRSDVRHFERWGGRLPATTEMIVNYLQYYASKLNARTLARRLTALSQWHLYQSFADPTHHAAVAKTLKGIQRIHGKPRQAAPAMNLVEFERLIQYIVLQTSPRASRDAALFQVSYFGALRRSEVASLAVEQLEWSREGVEILLTHSKTDPTHEGQSVALPFGQGLLCPVLALKNWLETADIRDGAIFRSISKGGKVEVAALTPAAINLIIKKRAKECGISNAQALSSHSFRRGMTTEAARAHTDIKPLMRLGRWKNVNTVMNYIEAAERFDDNVVTTVLNFHNLK